MNWASIIEGIARFLKTIFGTSTPSKTTVVEAAKDVEVSDGKTDEERLKELGIDTDS